LKDRLLGGESVDPNDPKRRGFNQPLDRVIQNTDFRSFRRGQRTYKLAHSSMPRQAFSAKTRYKRLFRTIAAEL
tara:strand:+ start:918 stop:1139 length:222 start_codon:yes stop_codon:yes gene_type:complete